MNRMFQVIVLGGVSLAGLACSGSVEVASHGATSGNGGSGGAATGGGGFPQEGAIEASSSSGFGGFPQEGPVMLPDAGPDAPLLFDAGTDAPTCFPPDETAFVCPDAGQASDAGGTTDAGFPQEAP
jgi:hypothetical protein